MPDIPENGPSPLDPPPATRRGLLRRIGFLGGLTAALASLPAIRLIFAPLSARRGEETWIKIGPATDFGSDRKDREYVYDRREGWYRAHLVRRVSVGKDAEDWVVFSTSCTHLGCGVTWRPESRTFFCPCHNGEFNADGSVKTAPPTRPLQRLETRVRNGQLEVKEA